MSLIYISGYSGAGKSTVRNELVKRGYEAYDTDEDGFSQWYNNQTGEIVRWPGEKDKPSDWFDNHKFKLSADKVNELIEKSKDKTIFLCGIPSNDIDFFGVFDRILLLEIDKETMKDRLRSRQTNNFGKSDDEIAHIDKWFDLIHTRYEKANAIMIDANQPLDNVVQEIIEKSKI